MLVEFDPAVFQNIANRQKFNFLLYLFYINRRYDFFIDLSQVSASDLYVVLDSNDQKIIEEYFNSSINDSTGIDFVISEQTNDDYFSIDEAIFYFQQPLTIILENSLNDKYFLEAVINNFSKRGKKIRRHLDNNWIVIANGGGCENIINVLTEKINAIIQQPKPPERYLRCIVIVDSDSTYPGEEKPSRRTLRGFLDKFHIPFHILIKREMENYLPEAVYGDIPENRDYIATFLNLTPIQKDYFDIEKGFERNLKSYSEDVQELYGSINETDFGHFRKGGLNFPNFKTEFPKFFLNSKVTQESLKRRVEHQIDDPNELETILDKVKKLI